MGEGGAGRSRNAQHLRKRPRKAAVKKVKEKTVTKKKKKVATEKVLIPGMNAIAFTRGSREDGVSKNSCEGKGLHGSRRAQYALLTMRNGYHCHLAVGLGGVFGVDFADHAVAAVALGGVEAGVGAFDKRIGVVAGLSAWRRRPIW